MFKNIPLLYITFLLLNFKQNFIKCELLDVKPNITAEIEEIKNIMKEWARFISKKLSTLSDLTRRDQVEESFASYTIEAEDWMKVVNTIATNIDTMMQEKIKAVKAIKNHAELLSFHRKEDINRFSSYDYYDASNLDNITEVEDRKVDIDEAERIWKCSIPTNVGDLCFGNSYQSDEPYASEPVDHNADKFEYRRISRINTDLGRCSHIAFLHRPKNYFKRMNLQYHPQFDANVNLNYSIVRVTPSVFNRGEAVLNEIRWSEALDLTFKCNFKRDPTLTYQYFGSPKGFLRFYPAMEWSKERYDNTFDFRTRSWYIEAMSSAKDIVILVDRSGSMKGYRRKIATQIVNSILDTLTDNDFVNIYTFTNTTESLVDCFNDTLVQANEENLRLLREQLLTIKDKFDGDISLGLEKAFPILWKQREARRYIVNKMTGARRHVVCNQAIMLITEGLDYDYNIDIFKKYNHLSQESEKYYRPIRVFTYLIGTEGLDAQRMKWIACANMGYYVNVSVVEEVREKVLKYLEVMSRPINLSPHIEPEPAWTALYAHLADRRMSNWLWKKNEGNRQRAILIEYEKQHMKQLGQILVENQTHFTRKLEHDYDIYIKFPEYKYLTTVSLPVYDRRPNKTSLLGVAAVDVPLDFVKQLAEPHRIGVNGYSFTITNNGYVLHHPDHRTEFAEHVLKPTFNRVDLTEVEISDNTHEARKFDEEIIKLRQAIVWQTQNKTTLMVRQPIDDMKRVMLGRRHYFYTGIGPFSIVIALPDKYGFFVSRLSVSDRTMSKIKTDLKDSLKMNSHWRVHPKWLYTCNTTRAEKSPEQELLHFLNTNESNCKAVDIYLVNALLKDVNVTNWYDGDDDVFKEVKTRIPHYYNGVVLTFMATHTGLTRWKDFEQKKDQRHPKHFANKHNKGSDEIFYRRAAEMNYEKRDMFMYSVPFRAGNYSKKEKDLLVTVSHVVFIKRKIKTKIERAPIAAVGYQILHRTLNHILQELKCKQPCKISCTGKNAWICYVVDNDGYIVLAEQNDYVGKSLADVNIALMKTMVKDGVFKEITVFDYQGTCYRNYHSDEVFHGPTTEEVKDKHMKCGTVMCNKTVEYLSHQMQKTIPTPCDIELKMYNYQFKNVSHLSPDQNDRDCPCPYLTEPIDGTNLLLVALDDKCCDKESGVPINPYPKEIPYKLSLPCHIAVNNNFTKRHYTKCINKNKNEFELNQNNSNCGGEGIVPLE